MLTIVYILKHIDTKLAEDLIKLNKALDRYLSSKVGATVIESTRSLSIIYYDTLNIIHFKRYDRKIWEYISKDELPTVLLYPRRLVMKWELRRKLKDFLTLIEELHKSKKNVIKSIDKRKYLQLYNNINELFYLPNISYSISYFHNEKQSTLAIYRIDRDYEIKLYKYRKGIKIREIHIVLNEDKISYKYFTKANSKRPKLKFHFDYDIRKNKCTIHVSEVEINVDKLITAILKGFPLEYKDKSYEFIYEILESVSKTVKDIMKYIIIVPEFIERVSKKPKEYIELITGLL